MTRARRTLSTTGLALGLIGASALVRSDPILIWNASASVPIGLYIVTSIDHLQVGDLVAVRPTAVLEEWLVENSYLGRDTPLLKRVAALPGTEICRDGNAIFVGGVTIAEARESDRRNRLLPVWRGCQQLSGDEIFFLNVDEPASLDGRYFGPLDADTIIGRATPLWIREG